MSIKTMNEFKEEELTTRSERLAYTCGKVMESIGKLPMWNEWLEEEDMYCTDKQREDYWEERCKEAWAAETTHGLTPEQLVEHRKMIGELRTKLQKLTYEAGCASVMAWEEMLEGAEFYADEAFYWHKQIALMERIIWDKAEKALAAKKAAAAAAAVAPAE